MPEVNPVDGTKSQKATDVIINDVFKGGVKVKSVYKPTFASRSDGHPLT